MNNLLYMAILGEAALIFLLKILTNPKSVLLFLLAVRPILNSFTGNSARLPGTLAYLNLAGVVNILLIVGGIMYILKNKVQISELPASKPYLVFIFIAGFTILISPDPILGVFDWARLLSVFIFYILLVHSLNTSDDIRKVVFAILASWFIPNLVGLHQMFAGTGIWDESAAVYRINATFRLPNEYSAFLMLYLAVIAVLLLYSRSLWTRVMLAAIGVLMLISLYHTYTRASFLGFLVAVTVTSVLKQRRWLILIALAVVFLLLFPNIMGRYGHISTGGGSRSVAGRLALWRSTIGGFMSSPIWGHGFASFQYFARERFHGQLLGAHNDYLRMLIETGLLGLGAFICTLVFLMRDALRTFRTTSDSYYQYLSLGSISALAGCMVTASFANIFVGPGFQWYLWTLAGIAYKASHIDGPSVMEDCKGSI